MIHVDCILQNPKFSPTFSLENDFVKSYANVKGSVHSAGPNELSQPRFTCDISLKSSPVLPHGKKKKATCTNASSTILLNLYKAVLTKSRAGKREGLIFFAIQL